MSTVTSNIAIVLAVLATGLGIGEFLLEVKRVEVREIGRAIKLATILAVGVVSLFSTLFSGLENLGGGEVIAFSVLFFGVVCLILGSEWMRPLD